MRPALSVLVTIPAEDEPMVAFGAVNVAVFVRLKASARNSSRLDSVSGKAFFTVTSSSTRPSASKMLRPPFPYVYRAGIEKAAGLNQRLGVRFGSDGSPVTSGRWPPIPVFALSDEITGVKGKPVRAVK